MALESRFQRKVIMRIKEELLPGCIALKNDPNYLQGFPDWIILYHARYAILEFKRGKNAEHRPNQEYYINLLGQWTFSAFIYPENEEQVLHDLQKALRPRRATRILVPK